MGERNLSVGAVASSWESRAAAFFEVQIDAGTAEARLQDFVKSTGLGEGILESAGNGTQGNVSFYALSLKEDGSPIEVRSCVKFGACGLTSCVGLEFGLRFQSSVWDECFEGVLEPHCRRLDSLPTR